MTYSATKTIPALAADLTAQATTSAADPIGTITTVAGNGTYDYSGDGGPATSAAMRQPAGIAIDAAGKTYIADEDDNRVRKVDTNGIITTVAGNGIAQPEGTMDVGDGGPATDATVTAPYGIVVDSAGNLLIGANHRIRKVDTTTGIITTVVNAPWVHGLALDRAGNLYYADQTDVWRVNSDGTKTRVAGTGICCGDTGDGGPATDAEMNNPQWLAFDAVGNLYISELGLTRMVDTNGIIHTVVGGGTTLGDGGPATSASLNFAEGIVVDGAGNLFINDQVHYRVRKVDTNGIITTVAGNGVNAVSGDGGPATSASVSFLMGIAIDRQGNLVFADSRRVRKVSGIATAPPIGGAFSAPETLGSGNPSEICPQVQRCSGDPVNTATGNFWETFDDFSIPGRGLALAASRTYNSLAANSDSDFGYGWSFTYGLSLAVANGTVTITQENGSQVAFTQSGSTFTPTAPRILATLVQNPDDSYSFTRRHRATFTFDSSGKLTSIKNLNGYTTTLTRPDASTLVVTDPAGRSITFTYTGTHITSATDPDGRSMSYAYDGAGNLTDVIDVGGGHSVFTYDSSHRMLTLRSPKFYGDTATSPAPVTTNHYDSSGRVDSQTDPLGRQTLFDYTSIPHSTKVTDPKGNVVVYDYEYGEVVSETRAYRTAQAATWTYTYDPSSGGLATVTDPLGNTSQATYDSNGNITSTRDPLGHTTFASYDVLNDVTSETDGRGNTTTYTYDASGNLLTKDQPLTSGGATEHEVTTYTYGDPSHPGDITAVTDPLGHSTSITRNRYGDVTASADEDGNKTTFTYNSPVSIGWVMTSMSPMGNTTTYVRDAFGRVTSVRDPLWISANPTAHQLRTAYDADGNVISTTDGNGQVTTYAYDNAGEVISTHRPDGSTLRNDYWPDGTLKDQNDGLNHATAYAYDALGHNTSVTDPLGRVTTFGYDAAGNRTTETDPGGSCATSPGTGCTRLTYDKAGELTLIAYSDGTTPTVSFTYDADGRSVSMSDGTGTSRYTYDSLGRLTQSVNGAGATVSYAYDRANRQTSITYPNGKTVTRDYDNAGRMTDVSDWLGNTTSFSWDADGHLVTESFPNSVVSATKFDNSGAITNIKIAKGTTTLANLAYTRDGGGLLASTTSTGVGVNETYQHDPVSRIKSVNTTSYSYDNADDITALGSTVQTFNAANELTKTVAGKTTTSFTYDSRGNRLTSGSGKSRHTYTYDQANRLKTVGGSATGSYTYNGDGLRMSKTVGKTTSAFSWDVSGLPLILSDGTWNYVYAPNGAPIEQISASNTAQYLHDDQLGSVRLVTDKTGANVATYTYDAWGRTTTKSGRATTQLQYAGQYADAETGLIYMRARYFDPATAQFLTRDPLAAKTRAPYAYASNSPFSYTDPTGDIGLAAAVIGTITGAVVAGVGYYVMGHDNGESLGAAVAGGAVGGFVGGFCEENGGFLAGNWCMLASNEASTFVQNALNRKLGDFNNDLVTTATVDYIGGKYLGLDKIVAPTRGRVPSKLSWDNIAAVNPNAERMYLNGTVSGVLSGSMEHILHHFGDVVYASYGDVTYGC